MKTNEEFYGAHLAHMETVKDKAVIIAKFAAEFSGAKTSRIVSRIKITGKYGKENSGGRSACQSSFHAG